MTPISPCLRAGIGAAALLTSCAVGLAAVEAESNATELQRERHLVGDQQMTVSNRQEITIKKRNDADVKNRELWYSKFDGTQWGAWQKHGIDFSRDTPIAWSPTEGQWRVYVRIQEISGLADPTPTPKTAGTQFIIDRTPPSVAVTFPPDGAKLRGGENYTITWTAADPHMHSSGITLKWARDNDDAPTVIASGLTNVGKYTWTTPQDMTANGRIIVEAADKALNVGSAQSTGIVIDAIAPSRNILGPAITAARDVDLAIRAQDAGPAGLQSVQLFFSPDNGTTWNPGPSSNKTFDAIAWQAPEDGTYQLTLVATDQSGNANPRPSGENAAQASILIDTRAPTVALASPIGIHDPNDKPQAPSRRVFKPNDQVHVSFNVQDPNIRKDGITVYLQTEQGGRWETLGSGLPPTQAYGFSVPNISTTSARVKVVATDVAGNSGEAVASEAFRIDNQVEQASTEIDL